MFLILSVLIHCSACGYWQSSRANHRYGGLSCLQDVHSDTAVEHCARCHVRLGVGAQICRSPFLSHISWTSLLYFSIQWRLHHCDWLKAKKTIKTVSRIQIVCSWWNALQLNLSNYTLSDLLHDNDSMSNLSLWSNRVRQTSLCSLKHDFYDSSNSVRWPKYETYIDHNSSQIKTTSQRI